MPHRSRAAVASFALLTGCVGPTQGDRMADERDAYRRAAGVDAALVERSMQELDRYRAHLAAGVDEQQSKDEQIATLRAELTRLQARCDAMQAALAAPSLATVAD